MDPIMPMEVLVVYYYVFPVFLIVFCLHWIFPQTAIS